MNPLDSMLGRPGDPIRCKRIGDISVHWWASLAAKPGDPCMCGERLKSDADVEDES